MSKTLTKLVWADTPDDALVIARYELACVEPHAYQRNIDIPGHIPHDVDVEIVGVGHEGDLLRVEARCWLDGIEVPVDNPLLYKNPPMMVPDGTYDENGVANFHENVEEALRRIVMETLNVTALCVPA